jgi:hypothetical protein
MAGVPRTLQVAGAPGSGVPAGATAVTVNVTVVNQSDPGYLAITPAPAACPGTSTLNFPLGDTRANGATVPLASDGSLSLTYIGPYADASTDVVLDVTGYFSASGGATFTPLTPTRVLDTRYDIGLSGAFADRTARSLKIAGAAGSGVPAGATAVTVNVTVVNQTAAGYLALTQTPTATPATSTLNFPLGDTRANGATVPLASDGSIGITFAGTSGASTDVVLDVTGYTR